MPRLPRLNDRLSQPYVTDSVTVNGVAATVSGGVWEADHVPVSPSGLAQLNAQVTDSAGNSLGGQTLNQPQPAMMGLMSYASHRRDSFTLLDWTYGYPYEFSYLLQLEDVAEWSAIAGGTNYYAETDTDPDDSPLNFTTSYPAGENGVSVPWENASFSASPAGLASPTQFNWHEYQNHTETQVMIEPSGQRPIGGTALYLVSVAALALPTPTVTSFYLDYGFFIDNPPYLPYVGTIPVAPETLQINGQNAANSGLTNGDGSVWAQALVTGPSGANVPVTITAPGLSGNNDYTFTNQVQEVTLRIFSGTNDVTGLTNTVIVGQQMNLSCQLSISNQAVSNIQWTIPGYAISNYVIAADTSSATVYSNFSTTGANVTFYWVGGGTRTVICSAEVLGQNLTANAAFNVLTPSADLLGYTNGTVSVDTNYFPKDGTWLHWGEYTALPNQPNYGTRFYATNIFLNGCPSNSTFIFVQLGTLQAELNNTNGTSTRYSGSGLDARYPADSFSAALYGAYHFEDYPGELVDGSAQVWRSDNFTMYLLFQTDQTNSIPVPLKKLNWSWSGVAQTNGSGGWTLIASSVGLSNINTLAAFPTWSSNLLEGTTISNNYLINPFP